MSNRKAFFTRTVSWVSAPILAVFLGPGMAEAQQRPANFTFVVGSGFLCDPAESGACPAMVKSAIGDRYEMSGAGTFSTQSKSTMAAGTFSHAAANGTVLETGVWLASELVSFDSYGVAPTALPRSALAFGRPPTGPRRLPAAALPLPTGGLALFRIRLFPLSGAATDAILQVNCALGAVPHERTVEGIRLTFERGGTQFSEEVSGRVMFLSMRPEASVPAKTPEYEAAPKSTETPTM